MIGILRRIRKTLHYHAVHNRKAWQMVRQLRAGGRQISRRDAIHAWNYAREVLGSHRYAPWLIAYATLRGRFLEGWIPDNYYGDIVAARINHPRDIADFKTFSARVLPPEALPDMGYLIDGQAYDRTFRLISRDQLVAQLYADAPAVMMKLDSGYSGREVCRLPRADFEQAVAAAPQQRMVFQRIIEQSDVFNLYSGDGATIRLTTTREPDGSFRLRTGYYKLPVRGEAIVREGECLYLSFDPDSGRAADEGWTPEWRAIREDPHSRARLADIQPPGLAAARELVLRIHATLPHLGCIGWDTMIDRQGQPWIIEWNTYHNGIFVSEVTIGPSFRGLNWEQLARRRPVRR